MVEYKYRILVLLSLAAAWMIGLFYAAHAGMDATSLFIVSIFFIALITGIDVFVFDVWTGGKNWTRTNSKN